MYDRQTFAPDRCYASANPCIKRPFEGFQAGRRAELLSKLRSEVRRGLKVTLLMGTAEGRRELRMCDDLLAGGDISMKAEAILLSVADKDLGLC